MASQPVLSVKVALASNPYDATPIWTEIGPASGLGPQGHGWARAITTKRGRERLLRASSQFQAGSATVNLDNRDRRFDPTNTASPYYPNVQPEKLLQIGATWASVFYPIWTGSIDDWPQEWPGMQEANVPLAATDLFKHLSLARLLSAGYQNQVLADLPRAYYRLNDPVGSSQAVDLSGFQFHAAANPAVTFGGAGAMPANLGTSASLAGGTGGAASGQILIPPGPFTTVGTGITLELWVKTTGVAGDNLISYPTTSNINVLGITAAGHVQIINSVVLTGTRVINDGNWHHVAVVMQTASQFRIFVDGTLDVNVGGPPVAFPNLPGAIGSLGTGGLWNADTVEVQDVALYNYALSAGTIARHFLLAAWPAGSPGEFVNQLLDTLGFPAGQRRIDNGYTLCQADTQSEAQNKVLDQMQKIEQTEQGQLFIGVDGYVNFEDRYHRYRSPDANPVATFGDGGPITYTPSELPLVLGGFTLGVVGGIGAPVTLPGELPYVMGGVTLNFDRMELFNDIQVTRRNGTLQTATNPASVLAFTDRTMQLSDLLMATDADALYCGEWILADTAYPQFRVGDLVLDPNTDDRLWPLVLGCEIGQVIIVNKRNIPGGGPAISLACRIEGIEHQIDAPKLWITKWHVSLMGTGHWGIYNDPVMGLYNGLCRWGW